MMSKGIAFGIFGALMFVGIVVGPDYVSFEVIKYIALVMGALMVGFLFFYTFYGGGVE